MPLDRGRFLEVDELVRFLGVARVTPNRVEPLVGRDYVLLSLAVNSGLREAEIRALTLSDPSRDEVGRPYVEVWNGKGKKSRRVFVNEDMSRLLSSFVRRRFAQGSNADAPIFEGRRKRPMSLRAMRDLFQRLRDAAGLRRSLSFHSLRHTFATHHYRANRNLVELSAILGHTSIKTTQVYVHASPEEQAESVSRLPRAFSPTNRRDRRAEAQPS